MAVARAFLVLFLACGGWATEWKAGAAKRDITPDEPIWLAGYGSRTRPSEGVLEPIYVKALALEDVNGSRSVLVTSDLVGLSRPMVDQIAEAARTRYGIPRQRLILNYSHNHSGPVTADVLSLYYDLTLQQKAAVDRYTRRLLDRMVEVIGASLEQLEPAELSFDQGLAGFAVNRRRARPGGRGLPGPVDHDVPVLAVHGPGGGLRAVVFGYACHATALSGYKINGDYPGFSQHQIEAAYPGAIALFAAGCGGDANPLPRVMMSTEKDAVELARDYGRHLAMAVRQVLGGNMKPVSGPLRAAYATTAIPFQKAPTREQLLTQRQGADTFRRRGIDYLLGVLDRAGKLPERYPYPVQVWSFGPTLNLIALTGEPVVDYSLRFKNAYGWDSTWVAGYSNELLSYVPSRRVLREGGYEGTEGMTEYGLPAPYAQSVEDLICRKVDELIRRTRSDGSPAASRTAGGERGTRRRSQGSFESLR